MSWFFRETVSVVVRINKSENKRRAENKLNPHITCPRIRVHYCLYIGNKEGYMRQYSNSKMLATNDSQQIAENLIRKILFKLDLTFTSQNNWISNEAQ